MTRKHFITISFLSLFVLVFIFLTEISFGARVEEEARLKTAYIYNFCKYVTWPAPPDNTPLEICVLGQDALTPLLTTLTKKKIMGKEVVVKPHSSCSTTDCCDVLFISATKESNLNNIIQSLEGHPILTISDIEGFARKKGMIELVKRGNKIRFIINKQSLDNAELILSSRLLKLATIVSEEKD